MDDKVTKILHYASSAHGLSFAGDESYATTVRRLIAEGLLEHRIRVVQIPAMSGDADAAAHARCFGMNPDAHEASLSSVHLTETGRTVWLRGTRR